MAIMKQVICILLFGAFSAVVYGQEVAIENEGGSTFFLGVRNRIVVAVSGYPAGSIVVASTNGEVKDDENGRKGHYTYSPLEKLNTEIIVQRKTRKGLVTVARKPFMVEEIPNPVATFAGKKSGNIYAAIARVQIAPAAVFEYYWLAGCAHFQIISFTFIVIRNDRNIFIKSLKNDNGVRFRDDRATQKIITKLKAGDKLLFSGIECIGPDKKVRRLAPMEFTLTDSKEDR